jgi:hypothetical protein
MPPLLRAWQKMQRGPQATASIPGLAARFSLWMGPMVVSSRQKGENMKTFIRSIVVAVVAAAFVLNVSAADGAKTPKGKGPVVVAGENTVMTCPKCKDDYLVKTTRPPKGTESEKAVIATHLCEKCSTKLVVKGEGKAKTDVAVHTCKGCK